MSERKVDMQIVRKQYANDWSLIDEAEIIDASAFNFDDTDGWLYIPAEYKRESMVHDLYTWLKSEPELGLSANRKSIDTRTFTRSKKRSSRTSFESILEPLSTPISNTWRTSNFTNIEEDLSKYADISTATKEEAVPPMFNVAPNTKASVLADETAAMSGQESMEVFLNMSQSKGIDSFINLMEPGIGDPLMNVSQPSIFYSSITSLPRDDCLHSIECDKDEKSANLTHLCSQEDDILEVTKILSMNETFSKLQEQDNNNSYCLSSGAKTFINKFDLNNKELNETYDADAASATVVLNSDKENSSTTLSSTFVNNDGDNTKILQTKKEPCYLNATFASGPQKGEEPFVLDTTYSARDTDIANDDITCTIKSDIRHKNQSYDLHKDAVHNVTRIIDGASTPIANISLSPIHSDHLNSTFKLPICNRNQSTPINFALRTTSKQLESTRVYSTALNSNMKAPTSLRKELLAEIHKSGDHRLDCTYDNVTKDHQNGTSKKEMIEEVPNQNPKNDIPIENKYNTYRKESSINKIKPHSEAVNEPGGSPKSSQDKKYYTFTKKASSTLGGKTDMENAETADNVDATFVKPFPKLQKQKQHIPKMLSKLPQFLQKSNPNLVSSSLKTVNMVGGRGTTGFGYTKGSQPNIVRDVEKSLGNKLYSFGKLKSGSEQRLLELNPGVGELQLLGVGGSTESIESTQSAHSAPDLDDRLSTCSDCSHNSYTTPPMNIEQLHQIVRMQEESLNQDTAPRLNNRVLENTWTDMKRDSISPILKNGVDVFENDSPVATDFTAKTSSPLLSPTNSSQSINTDGQPTENLLKQQNEADAMKKLEAISKPVMKMENKTTRLRPPTNWSSGNRPTNQMSAIPRPPSRIPGPRLARPAMKNIQGDIKRGYM